MNVMINEKCKFTRNEGHKHTRQILTKNLTNYMPINRKFTNYFPMCHIERNVYQPLFNWCPTNPFHYCLYTISSSVSTKSESESVSTTLLRENKTRLAPIDINLPTNWKHELHKQPQTTTTDRIDIDEQNPIWYYHRELCNRRVCVLKKQLTTSWNWSAWGARRWRRQTRSGSGWVPSHAFFPLLANS